MRVQKAIEVNVPADKVWPYFVEPERILQWCITLGGSSTPAINVAVWERQFTSRNKQVGL